MNNPKICAVVLNYKAYKETIACVNSILNQDYDNFEIVIVENGSNNESLEKLEEKFSDNKTIHILSSEQNLGFARGNNLGIVFARDKLSADFVFVVNSDIVVPRNLFYDISKIEYAGIGAISPTVYRADGSYQMPTENTSNIKKRIKHLIIHLLIAKCKRLIKRSKPRNKTCTKSTSVPNKWNDYVLQGCAYFLTPEFFKKYNILYPKTFLYWEEINLLYYLYKANLKAILVKTDVVVHKDKGSTRLDAQDLDQFQLMHSFRSMLRSLPLFFKSYKGITNKYSRNE